MTDYTELIRALRCCGNVNADCTVCPWDKYNFGLCAEKLYTDAAAAIEALQAQLPKRGEMYFLEYDNPETGEFEQTYFQCSVCGKYFYGVDECEAKDFNYCPNCGAKMNDSNASNASNALNALDNAQDDTIVTPCRGCFDYDGYGGCKSKGGCARAKMEVQDDRK